MKFLQSYFTDIGIKRKTNQDSLAMFKADTHKGEVLFVIICDGMGGYQSGELASKTIVEAFEKWFKLEFPNLLYKEFTFEQLIREWRRIVNICNSKLVLFGKNNNIDMGSTLTAGLFVEDKYYIVHVGDSRAYEITSKCVNQITEDQSFVAEAIRKGELSIAEAKRDKRRNVLMECIGITPNVNALFYEGKINARSTYLFCSDGFWHNLSDEELVRYLSGDQFENNKMLRMHLNYLVEIDKERDEKDNISVIGLIPYKENH